MRSFFCRFLPADERRTALWLVLGGALIATAARLLQRAAADAIASTPGLSAAGGYAVQTAAAFALTTVLVIVMIRFLRAPRSMALYLVLTGVLAVVSAAVLVAVSAVVVAVTGGPTGALASTRPSMDTFWNASVARIGMALGALAGAWIAATVSVERIRATRFDADEETAQSIKPVKVGWWIVGWDSWPATGDQRVALALSAVLALPAIVASLNSALLAAGFSGGLTPEAATYLSYFAMPLVVGVAWTVSAFEVTRRSDVASAWFASVGALLPSLVTTIWLLVEQSSQWGVSGALQQAGLFLPQFFPVLAALAGAALALRGSTATLTAHPQDPGDEPADTAGGTDG